VADERVLPQLGCQVLARQRQGHPHPGHRVGRQRLRIIRQIIIFIIITIVIIIIIIKWGFWP
jgi:hypothetical protein